MLVYRSTIVRKCIRYFSCKTYSQLQWQENIEFVLTWQKSLFYETILLFRDLMKPFVLLTLWENILQSIALGFTFEQFVG